MHKSPAKAPKVAKPHHQKKSLKKATTPLTNASRQYSKHRRYEEIVESIKYIVPQSRIKQTKSHAVKNYRNPDGSQLDYQEPYSQEEHRATMTEVRLRKEQEVRDKVAAGGEPRKFSLRKRYLYDRNRTIIEKANAILIIQPGSDPEFFEIMGKLGDSWNTAHFRNGMVHLDDKPYAKLKEFFKGPIRVLLQNDPAKTVGSYKKLVKVLKDHPNTFFLGGAIDGFAGVAKDFEELQKFDSKQHVQGQLIQALSGINSLIPAVEYPTKSFAQLLNHHEKEIEKQKV